LLCENGVYGERLRAMAERRRIPVVAVEAPWTRPIEAGEGERILSQIADVDAIALVHHETTTGLLNPLAGVAALARLHDVRLVVDAVSSFGAEEISLAGSGIDFLCCSANKCLHGLPGAAFVLVSPAGAARAAEVRPTSLYLDLTSYLEASAA